MKRYMILVVNLLLLILSNTIDYIGNNVILTEGALKYRLGELSHHWEITS